jgi:hypothetical protein
MGTQLMAFRMSLWPYVAIAFYVVTVEPHHIFESWTLVAGIP